MVDRVHTPTFYLEYPVTVGAGESVTIAQRGRNVRVLDISGSNVTIQVDNSEPSTCRKGIGIILPDGDYFQEVRLTNGSGSGASVTLAIAIGEIQDSRLTLTGSIKTYSGDTMATPVKVTVGNGVGGTVIVAADSTRTMVTIQNKSTTDSVWLGDSGVDPANNEGIEITPGGDMSIPTSAEIRGRCAAGKTADVSIMEIKQ